MNATLKAALIEESSVLVPSQIGLIKRENERLLSEGKPPARFLEVLWGITKGLIKY